MVVDGEVDRVHRVSERLRDRGVRVMDEVAHPEDYGETVLREQPDVTLIITDDDKQRLAHVLEEIVDATMCPVVALLADDDELLRRRADSLELVTRAPMDDPDSWPGAIAAALEALRRPGSRQEPAERRGAVERAKGVLMERHRQGEEDAYRALRNRARRERRSLVAVAQDVLDAHAVLSDGDARGR